MLKQIASIFSLILLTATTEAQLSWPPITQTTKPWTRWWWEGSAVNKKDLTWNLEQYKKAGLGGVEITPIYGVYGYEEQFVNFLSPEWMNLLQHTLRVAKRTGLGVDMANATGWPFGGPWISENDASKTIYFKTYTVKEGKQLDSPVIYMDDPLVRTANNRRVSIDTIAKPVYKNKNLQALALDQLHYADRLPVKCLMAFNGESKIELTDKIDVSGKLNWTAPAGTWTLYALFEGLHGKMVERAAPGGEGYAIDHFSATAAQHYFKKFDDSFKGYDLSYLRGFFNDSYEVDDARGQGNWTADFFTAFKNKKGYDLKEYLPALFGKDDAETNSRVIYDYRSVIDELILDNFTKQWKKWATSKGKIVRNQSHGSPANTLDLYSVVDIPETEGNDILRFKFATSAANVTGKKLVSSESATWLNEHFLSSLGDVKQAIDLFFLGGVNHIFYHGTAYSPEAAPWPGWLFYAAVHFQPTNPQWKDFHKLNEYITRTQSFLQSSKPDNDVLVYYPIADRYSEPGAALLQHFDGMERNFEHTDFEQVSKWMLEKGYSFDFFSDRQLSNFTMTGNKISNGGNSYQAILLPGNKLIPEASMQKLAALAGKGATILFYKDLPADIPGLTKLAGRRSAYKQLLSGFSFKKLSDEVRIANKQTGRFIIGSDLDRLFSTGNIRQETMSAEGLQFVRRKNGDTTFYFIANKSDKTFDGWAPVSGTYKTVLLFDAMNTKMGAAATKAGKKMETDVRLQLHPGESIILKAFKASIPAKAFEYTVTTGEPVAIKGSWAIDFLTGGPVLPSKAVTDQLGSWTALEGEAVKNFSGTAKYSISFAAPAGNAGSYVLDLGKVNETAEVILNGKSIATLIGPAFQCVIPSSLLRPVNTLEIVVANLMANRIAYMDRNHIPWKMFYNTNMPARRAENSKNGLFDAGEWKPLPSGLLGPVTLAPVVPERL